MINEIGKYQDFKKQSVRVPSLRTCVDVAN